MNNDITPLKWLKRDPYHCESECGRYSIARSQAGDVSTFLAFRRGADGAILLGQGVTDFRDAEQLCNDDANTVTSTTDGES